MISGRIVFLLLRFFILSCIEIKLFILLSVMSKNKKYLYFFIEQLDEINLDYVKKIGAILILRKPEKHKLTDLKKFKNKCSRRMIDLYISNNVKILFYLNSNSLYISAHNKGQFNHLKGINSNISIIGSAHNTSEIKEKLDQGCKQIFLSRLFSTNYKFKKGFLGRARFNLLSQNFSTKFIALGGIKKENFSKLKGLNIVGFAMSSDKKKAGTYVPAFFKK